VPAAFAVVGAGVEASCAVVGTAVAATTTVGDDVTPMNAEAVGARVGARVGASVGAEFGDKVGRTVGRSAVGGEVPVGPGVEVPVPIATVADKVDSAVGETGDVGENELVGENVEFKDSSSSNVSGIDVANNLSY